MNLNLLQYYFCFMFCCFWKSQNKINLDPSHTPYTKVSSQKNKSVPVRMWRNWNPHILLVEMQNACSHLGEVWPFLKMSSMELPYNPAIPLLDRTQKNWKCVPRKPLYTDIQHGIIHNSQKVETTQTPISWWMSKQNVV